MKLITMTDFVLEQNYITTLDISQIDFYDKELSVLSKIRNYANFLKKPLKLEMFVTCDDNGNVLEDIIGHGMIHNYSEKLKQYEQAKDKVLFDGFDIYSNGDLHNAFVTFESSRLEIMNVENLITDFQYSFYLTPNAIKRIFG